MRVLFVALLALTASNANAKTFFGGGAFSSQGDKENVRWTLGDWLTQKKSFAVMDQWLAVNTQANLFEVNIEGGQSLYEFSRSGNLLEDKRVDRYSAQIWVSIFGLQYTHEESDEGWEANSGQLNVRVFGKSTQTTNMTLHYGVRQWEDQNSNNEYSNQYGGANLNIYIVSFFGIEGGYRKYFTAEDKTNRKIEGEKTEYGAFIDVSFVRLYGNAFVEKTYINASGTKTMETREGVDAGVKFYF